MVAGPVGRRSGRMTVHRCTPSYSSPVVQQPGIDRFDVTLSAGKALDLLAEAHLLRFLSMDVLFSLFPTSV